MLRATALQGDMCAGSKMRLTSLSSTVSPVQSAGLFQTGEVCSTGGVVFCTLTCLAGHITVWATHIVRPLHSSADDLLLPSYAGTRKLRLSVSSLTFQVRPVGLIASGEDKCHLQSVQTQQRP